MKRITENAYAKINLTLDVKGESFGFHLLDMLVASVELHDDVTVTVRNDEVVTCTTDGRKDDGNSAVKAANLMMEKFGIKGCDVAIKKRIPVGGGMGGSAADGVAVVRALQKLYGISDKSIDNDFLLKIGSDAPAMYRKGVKRVRGIGEIIDFIDIKLPYKVAFIAGNGVSTPECFRRFDELKIAGGNSTESLIENVGRAGFDIAEFLHNDLLPAAISLNEGVAEATERMISAGAEATSMSGSGSAVFGLFDDDAETPFCETCFIY